MKITQDVREYAAQKEIYEHAALGVGMKEKAEEFVAAGGEIYQGLASVELHELNRQRAPEAWQIVAPGEAKRNPGIKSDK